MNPDPAFDGNRIQLRAWKGIKIMLVFFLDTGISLRLEESLDPAGSRVKDLDTGYIYYLLVPFSLYFLLFPFSRMKNDIRLNLLTIF